MEVMFVEAHYTKEINYNEKELRKLPARLCITTTVTYINKLGPLVDTLKKLNKKLFFPKGRHALYPGQILGCDILAGSFKDDCDAFVYVGDGMFHPKALLLSSDKEVFVLNPLNGKLKKFDRNIITSLKKRVKGALAKFYSSSNIGVLVTTKPGQFRLSDALALQSRFPEKNFYILMDNTFDFKSLENFPFIECFVNTACPRIAYDDSINFSRAVVNIDDVLRANDKTNN